MSKPFITVPWNEPFLPALIDIALEETSGDIGDAFFVFPHARPALYLTELLRKDERVAKPCLMPRMESVSGLFALMRSSIDAKRTTPVGMLDQVALLLAAVRELREERGGLLRDLPLEDSRRFFPWGVRLAALMEEFFAHCRVPEDYIHVQDEVTPFAAALLENLGALHARYLAALEERGWTTPGLDASITAAGVSREGASDALASVAGKRVILAGFHSLTGAQNIVFRHLWERCGATVCLHADPRVSTGAPHWSCNDLVRWAGAWRTTIRTHEAGTGGGTERPRITFRAGYDVHSQLGDLAERLKEQPRYKGATAIVLPDTGLLLPVLHHLPNADVNISMGYPLDRSPLFRLLESMLSLRETRRGAGPYTYYWKTLIAILRHPYCKMLDPFSGQKDGDKQPARSFRRFLHHAERVVRASRRYLPLHDFADRCAETFAKAEQAEPDPAMITLFKRILETAVFQWERVSSSADIAAALENLTALMHDHGMSLWARFPIDAECLYRLTESVIPQLAHTALAEETLPPETLFAVLRQLLASERVPFEAYPLVGDQVMGVLETRLLHFDRVFIVDLTDDRLPGRSGHDPLLPDALRRLAGLPGTRGREQVAAYNFFRLIAGAKDVTLYWQEGVEAQGLNDAKKMRSRFVEELLWDEEKKSGRILAPEKAENAGHDGPLHLISCTLPPVPREHRAIPATASARQCIRTILRGDLSPTLLDTYLGCPARFYYSRIARIREVDTVAEGRDPLGTGKFLHAVLQKYFETRLNAPVTVNDRDSAALRLLFRSELASSDLFHTLPTDDRIMLEEAGPVLLEAMLKNHAGRVPVHVEETFRAALDVDGERHTLAGVIDRVDEVNGAALVLDYKTGHLPLIDRGVWQEHMFWNTLASWRPGDGDEALTLAASSFQSIQLPAYVFMVSRHTGRVVHDAAYVPVKAGAKDATLFGDDMGAEERETIVAEKIPLLFAFLLRHMRSATAFPPRPGPNCDWCLFKKICIVTPR